MEEKNLHEDRVCCAGKSGCCSKPCWRVLVVIGVAVTIFLAGYGVGRITNDYHFEGREGCPMMRFNKQDSGWQRQQRNSEQLPIVEDQAEQPTSTIQN